MFQHRLLGQITKAIASWTSLYSALKNEICFYYLLKTPLFEATYPVPKKNLIRPCLQQSPKMADHASNKAAKWQYSWTLRDARIADLRSI